MKKRALVGRTVGDFVVKEKLGEGGFGEVYLAEQPALSRQAVIKVLKAQHTGEVTKQRFLREARLASKLDHPYAAHIYAFGAEADGLYWIAMEHVRGTPLSRLLRTSGPLPLERTVQLMERICEVVHGAHEQGIVHRDLKPANVMVLSRSGRLLPKLLDFGIAKLRDQTEAAEPARAPAEVPAEQLAAAPIPASALRGETESFNPFGDPTLPVTPADALAGKLTQRGIAVGSPAYMAPEQWVDAGAADARADIYALGVVTFECLTGAVPFSAGDVLAVAQAHARRPVPPLGPAFPAELDAVLARALAKQAGDRYDDALAFAQALRRAAGLSDAGQPLPRLADDVRQLFLADAPQPLAEAVALLDAARNAHQARDALDDAVRATVRWLGVLALACRTRGGADGADPPAVAEAVRALRRRVLGDGEWVSLARELTRPFAARRDAHPLPELVALLADGAELLERVAAHPEDDSGVHAGEEALLEILPRRLGDLEELLRATAWLCEYRLVVRGELWMGTRRPRRAAVAIAGKVPEGACVLLGADDRPVLSLAPLMQVASPTPGAAEELFLFVGRGRGGARLVAHPAGFERHDDDVWDFLSRFLPIDEDTGPQAVAEGNPYRGLAAFTAADAELFFGRERQVEEVVNRLRIAPLVAVVGPSGAGKSSFVQAGVVPALGDEWRVVTLRPGAAPLAALAAVDRSAPGKLLLIVDQTEELFTLCGEGAEREAFAAALADLAGGADGPVRVILTMRDDFLVRAERLAALRGRLAQGLVILSAPAPADLERILVEPARRAGYDFDEPDLPRRMVAEIADEPGALALLSFTAARLWDLRDRGFKQLLGKTYTAMGGVGGALADHAERTLAAMSAEEQRAVREAFRRLVTAAGTRAVAGRAELRAVLGDPAVAESVLEKLVAARLLVAAEDRIEVVHEALLSHWPRLVDWRRDDAEGARLRDQLRAAAEQWEERGRPRGLLWRGDALAEYRRWRARYPGQLAGAEAAFAAASLREAARGRRVRTGLIAVAFAALAAGSLVLNHLRRRAADSAAEAKERLLDSREQEARRLYLAGDAMRALVYLAEAYRERPSSAPLRYLIARATRQLAAETARLPHVDAITTARFSPDGKRVVTASGGAARVWDAGGGALLASFELGEGVRVTAASFAPDGATLAVAGDDGHVLLLDAEGARRALLTGHRGTVLDVVFDADGRTLLSKGDDGTVRVWDTTTGAPRAVLDAHAGPVHYAALDADGGRALTATGDGRVRLWDVGAGRVTATMATTPGVQVSATFSRDGRRILAASGTAVRLFAGDGSFVAACEHPLPVTHAEFSADGTALVTTSQDALARIFDAEDGKLLHPLIGHVGRVSYATFSPDGTLVATASDDGTARLWDAKRGVAYGVLAGHLDAVVSAHFSPDGTRLVTHGTDRTARLWATARAQPARALLVGSGGAWFASWRRDGARFATTGADRRVRIFSAAGEPVAAFAPTAGMLSIVQYSPDGRRLAAATSEGYLVLDAETGAELRRFPMSQRSAWCDFLPDGRRLAVAAGRAVHILDVDSGALLERLPPHGAEVAIVVASHDGARVASAGQSEEVHVVALASRAVVLRIPGSASAMAWRPDDAELALGGSDNAVRLVAVPGGAVRLSLYGHGGMLQSVAYSPGAELVLTASSDRTVRVWDGATGQPLDLLGGHALGVQDAAFTPDGRGAVSVGEDDAANQWDLSLDARSPAEIDALVRCRIPLQLGKTGLLPAETQCGP